MFQREHKFSRFVDCGAGARVGRRAGDLVCLALPNTIKTLRKVVLPDPKVAAAPGKTSRIQPGVPIGTFLPSSVRTPRKIADGWSRPSRRCDAAERGYEPFQTPGKGRAEPTFPGPGRRGAGLRRNGTKPYKRSAPPGRGA